MDANDYYIISLKYLIEKKQLKQKDIAIKNNFEPKNISDFIHKRLGFSEQRKEQIAKYLGTTYLDMLILGRELSSKSAESALLTEPEKRTGFDFGTQAADDHPGTGEPDQKDRMIEKITQMLKQMDEDDTRDIERMSAEKLEKKRIKQELEIIRRQLQERKAG